MGGPKVSVLLSVLNGERYLRAALDSVLGQTFYDFELLAADDGSKDGTWEILQQYAAADGRLALVRREQNAGITRSMNDLFARARGEYVTRHDADDLSKPERLAQQVAYLDAHPEVGVLATRVDLIDADGRLLNEHPYFNLGLENEALQQHLLVNNCFCQGSVMFRAALIRQVGDYDTHLEQAEDYDLWLRMAEVTRLARLPAALYQYRHHPASVTKKRRHQMVYNHAQVLDKTIFRRSAGQPSPQAAEQAARAYLEAALLKAEAGDYEAGRASIIRVLNLCPAVLTVGSPQLETLLGAFTRATPAETGHELMTTVFSRLPESSRRWQSRWMSRWHMRQVFKGRHDSAERERHLWAGLRHDPAWLLNRGVVALVMRAAGRRLRPTRRQA